MLLDLHIHTTRYSSRCSLLDPRRLAGRLLDLGLDGGAITEHNHLWSRRELDDLTADPASEKLVLVSGKEVESEIGHLLIFGAPGTIKPFTPLTEITDFVHRAGGVVIWAHPLRHGRWDSAPDEEIVRTARACDAVEALTPSHSPGENERMTALAKKHGLAASGGSDAHAVESLGRCVTRFHRPIAGLADLLAAIRAGACSPELGPAGLEY
ncbi:MAG: CehA/McbA family metallohydrolase [Pseudomonadota bacterium]